MTQTAEPTVRRGAGRPTKHEAAAIDGRILDCARAAFCRSGINACAVDEIAAEAGVTKHTIYRRYPTKLALLEAVVDRKLSELSQLVAAEIDEGHDPVETLRRRALRLFTDTTNPENQMFILFLEAEGVFSEELRGRFLGWETIAIAPLCEMVEEIAGSGRLMTGDVRETCLMLGDLLHGASRRLVVADCLNDPATIRAMFDSRWALFARAAFRAGG